ncbi:methyltransferase domain-containing protein [Psychroflexus sp. YR1-1]|uniref:Methyltransferase domain-containing protein n=1 Tax=Psychroflexus aurantiacus TaxID=2709310 RepID=A0A6B3QY50_9FLAO|nr:methyltransferase domain-containing protein [Psychroflexus aurantiacus]NEV93183.1 methyltransferase domain-containing protein [Psychroflexus aurantiacus]
MKRISTKTRSKEAEIMDKFDFKGEELKHVLKTIDRINTKLGGHRVTIKGIQKLLENHSKKHLVIADLGCGSGDALRHISRWAKTQGINVQLIGIDANPYTIEIAREWSRDYKNISYRVIDVFSEDFDDFEADIITCCLTLHHFENDFIKKLVPVLSAKAGLGLVVNDLQRSKMAYRLFELYCSVFVNSDIARKDGLTSILRGFKTEDFVDFAKQLNLNHHIAWYWAFRYQWIIYSS